MSFLKNILETVLPSRAFAFLSHTRRRIARARVKSRPVLTESAFTSIVTGELGLKSGDVVFVHSSIDQLNLNFHTSRILALLQNITGPQGTLLFPTYPPVDSYEFLRSGQVFDVRRSQSYTGVLTEIARRNPKALRSLHPTKSVCAIGLHARELVSAHQCSVNPYDRCSPYYKIMEYGGKAVGIGVSTENLAFVHCVEDALQSEFPVAVYHGRLFSARCINYSGEEEIVRTYAHDMNRVNHRTVRFMKRYISEDVCKDLTIQGMRFFRADSQRLFAAMRELARAGVTIYPKPRRSARVTGHVYFGPEKPSRNAQPDSH